MYKINLWKEKISFHNLLKMYVEVHACAMLIQSDFLASSFDEVIAIL